MAKEELEVALTEERVKIYAVSAKHKEKPFYATGITDSVTKTILTGQEDLGKAEREKFDFKINPMENYMIRNNDELILKKSKGVYVKDKDYALYLFYKVQPNIAHSRSEVVKGTHDFYLQNFEAEAEKTILDHKTKAKASAKILDLSLSDMINLLYFFGENASLLSSKIAEAKVFEIADSRPTDVVAYFENLEDNQKVVFVKKLLSKGIISRAESSNYLMYNKIILGANENEAASFLYDNKNESVYIPLKDMLDKAK
jgi:hypothetical protein